MRDCSTSICIKLSLNFYILYVIYNIIIKKIYQIYVREYKKLNMDNQFDAIL